jgi:hypothetical protein
VLVAEKYILKLYLALYSLVIALFVIPWAYFDKNGYMGPGYSFFPRKIIFVLMAVVGLALVLSRKISSRKIIKVCLFGVLGLAHWKIRGYIEPHYFFEFIYLELALLILFAPVETKQKMLKYSSLLLYIVLLKAFIFHMGNYIHGGFFSSNLFATYIVYLSFIEIYRKKYWNLIPAILMLYMVGSKSSYISITVIILLFLGSNIPTLKKVQIWFEHSRWKKFNNFYISLSLAAISILIFTLVMARTDKYKAWSEKMAPSIAETTKNNMIMYGLDRESKFETEKGRLLNIIEDQFKENPVTLKPLITDVGMSIGLRVTQYDYMYSNLMKYFWLGDTEGSQVKMMGHNPHSAVIDFISRLGLLYLILVLFFYSPLFKAMNLFMLNVSIMPILAFQPYGFSIGHSIVILAFVYSLAKEAKEQSSRT